MNTTTATIQNRTTRNYLGRERLTFEFALSNTIHARYTNVDAYGYTGHDAYLDRVQVMVCKGETETTYTVINEEGRRLEIQGTARLDGEFRQFRKPVSDNQDEARAAKVLAKWLAA